MKQSLTIRIPDDLRQELQEISKAEAKPVSDLVRESIQKYISIYRFHQIQGEILSIIKSNDIETDDFLNLQMSSKAYMDWISSENDIYDEVFKDEID